MVDGGLTGVLRRAGAHVDRARFHLDAEGGLGIDVARAHLEAAVLSLGPVADDGDDVARWRAALASCLLAAKDVDAAGAAPATIARLLRRACDPSGA